MNNDLIRREDLKKAFFNQECWNVAIGSIIDSVPSVKPCENCDLYFKAMTKEEMRKGGAE